MAQRKGVFTVAADPSSAVRQSKAAEQGRRSGMSATALVYEASTAYAGSVRCKKARRNTKHGPPLP